MIAARAEDPDIPVEKMFDKILDEWTGSTIPSRHKLERVLKELKADGRIGLSRREMKAAAK